MANLDLTAITAVLEELYSPADNTENILRANPLLGLIPHKTSGGGKYRHVQLRYTRPQGRSAVFATAQSNAIGSKRVAFDVTWTNNYQVAGIDGDVIDDAQGNKVMLLEHVKTEMDGAIDNIRDDIGMNLFRNKGGARGQVGSGTASPVTLSDVEEIAHFEVGMKIVASNYDGSGSGTDRSGTGTITDIDRDLGIITYTGTITGLATSDFLFVDGDRGAKMSGIAGWMPYVAPTSTAFFGVDRTSDPVRLAGVRYDGTSDTTAQALVNAATRVRRNKVGSPPDIAVCSPLVYGALDIALEGRKRIVEFEGANAGIGYRSIELDTPAGAVKIVSDPSCPAGRLYLLNTKSWCFETVGDMIRVLDEDGNPILRQSTSDGYELRVKCRGNFYTNEPGSNAVTAL